MSKQSTFIIIIVLIIIGVISLGLLLDKKNPGQYDQLALCINESGAKFYNAFWCSHCQEQKKMFGSSAKYLPSIECSSPDGQKQLDVCSEAGIDAYPTWVFADGSRQAGGLSLETLAEKTNCSI
jgi:hypothetical protein